MRRIEKTKCYFGKLYNSNITVIYLRTNIVRVFRSMISATFSLFSRPGYNDSIIPERKVLCTPVPRLRYSIISLYAVKLPPHGNRPLNPKSLVEKPREGRKNKIGDSIDQKLSMHETRTRPRARKFLLDQHRNRRRNCFFGKATIG